MTKHFSFAYMESYWLAGAAIGEFYEYSNLLFPEFYRESRHQLIPRLLKPHKWTIMHEWIIYVFNFHHWYADRHFEKSDVFSMESKIVEDAGFLLSDHPDFDLLIECDFCGGCIECSKYWVIDKEIRNAWEDSVTSLVHTVFHLFMSNKEFLRDFNEYISECMESDINLLMIENPEQVDGGEIRRVSWPKWLERAIIFRDKGVCSICRKDVSGTLNLENKYAIDHIVPIANYGSNDPTNLQLLCWECNAIKSNKSSETNNIDIPLWNIESDMIP
jgi:hypothetical protein